ncbi:S-adenosyl-L-methionine-dependent methyltransferase [Phanerochaete sordida]|uniref:S-adenosyl-L-methionine-dependent methyltransferase n=1 Tax=Phanerochaete sordida TaxID=48140 RepID=A0A9P3GEL5_9APHY|nr:S-adenosyl-L-methionine-dependent methyltransferase [Phanerochaete sordida]
MSADESAHDYAAANKKIFDKKAAENTAIPAELSVLARAVTGALLLTYPTLFDRTKTELLDFACGAGLVALELAPHVRSVLGVDISEGVVERFNERAAELGAAHARAVAARLDTGDGAPEACATLEGATFDVVLCSFSYHHVASIAATTRTLARFLRPGGALLVLDTLRRSDTAPVEEIPEEFRPAVAHVGGFTEAQMREAFEAAGLVGFEFGEAMTKTIMGREQTLFIAKGVSPQL